MFAESRSARLKDTRDHWGRMRGRARRTRREERERREEEGKIEGDEAARTDGCCQGSAKKV